MEDAQKIKLERPSPAKQAEERALGHAATLSALSKEPHRSPEDEEYLRELLQEGHKLRTEVREAQPQGRTVNVDREGVVLTSGEVSDHVDRVRLGENPDIRSND